MKSLKRKKQYNDFEPVISKEPIKEPSKEIIVTEKRAKRELSRFDPHFGTPDTTVTVDSTLQSKDGSKAIRVIVARNGKDKYYAKLSEKNKKMDLVSVTNIKAVRYKKK